MGNIKQINITNCTYYFFNDMIIDMIINDIIMINDKNFDLNFLKIDKNSYKNIDIYYIGYITIKDIGDYGSIYCVNVLYFITGEVDIYIE